MRSRFILLLFICSGFVIGCGEPKLKLPSPVAASGKVTLANGQPAKNVRIFFEPIDAMAPASSPVASDGTFKLKTYDNKEGACPGKYRILFRVDQADPNNYKASSQALQLIPQKYQEDGSPLEVEIPSGGKTDIDLRLDAR
ncbi:MAG: hypothetical protein ACKO23_16820 [Gemmataceae bacterium]